MTKLCSGQGNPAAADATTDESNPYMSPSQVTQKQMPPDDHLLFVTKILKQSVNIYSNNIFIRFVGYRFGTKPGFFLTFIFVLFDTQIFKMISKINFSVSLKTQSQINCWFWDSEIRIHPWIVSTNMYVQRLELLINPVKFHSNCISSLGGVVRINYKN